MSGECFWPHQVDTELVLDELDQSGSFGHLPERCDNIVRAQSHGGQDEPVMLFPESWHVLNADPVEPSSTDEFGRSHEILQPISERLKCHSEVFLVGPRKALLGVIEEQTVGAVGSESRNGLTSE